MYNAIILSLLYKKITTYYHAPSDSSACTLRRHLLLLCTPGYSASLCLKAWDNTPRISPSLSCPVRHTGANASALPSLRGIQNIPSCMIHRLPCDCDGHPSTVCQRLHRLDNTLAEGALSHQRRAIIFSSSGSHRCIRGGLGQPVR